MTRRPGVLAATLFFAGALLGLLTSAVFLGVEASEIRSTVEYHASARPGPMANLVLSAFDESDVFTRIADDLRADQIRNIAIAGLAAALMSAVLGMSLGRRLDTRARCSECALRDRKR